VRAIAYHSTRRFSMTARRIRAGVLVGLIMASFYSAWALLMHFLAPGSNSNHTTIGIGAVIAAYFGAGIVGGAVIGSLSPLARSWTGMVVLGMTTGIVFFFFIETATSGPFWTWQANAWKEVTVLGLGLGTVGALVIKLQRRR